MWIYGGSRRPSAAVTLSVMHEALSDALVAHDGILRRDDALKTVDHRVLERAVTAGHVCMPFPRTYMDPAHAGNIDSLMRAATSYADGCGALSHTSALRVWRLPTPSTGPIHLTTDTSHHLRGASGLQVHRCENFVLCPPEVVVRDGLAVTCLERTIVDSWPLLDGDAKRAPAIDAVNQRLTTPDRLADALAIRPRLAGRRQLARMIGLLETGCRSHLELWGYNEVFTGPAFASLQWQYPVSANGRTFYLDALDLATGVNFELDGAKYHGSFRDRERDLRRDGAVQTLGILVVRLSHDRLVHEPKAVRLEAQAIMAARPTGWALPPSAAVAGRAHLIDGGR